jgi:type II secretory pathway component PulJ
MKMLNQGSLLVELLIYVTLFAILGVMGFAWFSRSQRQLLATAQSTNGLMSLYSATDLLVRDLRASPQDQRLWLAQEAETIIWRTAQADIGWYKQNKSLYRVEGSYNQRLGKWNKKKRSIAIQNLESIDFQINQEHGQIQKVEVTLAVNCGGTKHTAQETVYPREAQV